ncbi:meiosis initiator protein isoform X2 [Sphaerodactylus townsendi]|uniref:meiosis initiator protein isoform X2 n=1 Tax=Sphaerodactylus townsendi TaxID=933632 RepID=UPI0020271B3E|nr:meiosis initiator protein isoform X2 [Sphaerodactylus townsendi]
MWDQTGCVCPEELQPSSKNCKQDSSDRKESNNYTSTLRELAQMLPVPLRTSSKRLTKKEILLRVLRYIEHLQTSIHSARSLLQHRCGEQKGESEQMSPSALKRRRRETTPRGKKTKAPVVCKKPRKARRIPKSERRGASKKACKCLPLEPEEDFFPTDPHREESLSNAEDASSVPSLSQKQYPFLPSFQDPGPAAHWPPSTNFWDITKNRAPFCASDWHLGSGSEEIKDRDVFSACVAQMAYDELRHHAEGRGHLLMGQELVCYYSSCEEEEDEVSRASPWLSTQSPVGISHGSLLLCSPSVGAQSNTCSDLGLSPSLFSSPGRLLPKHVLQGGQEELSPVLFEDVYLSPQTFSGTLLRKSAFTLDHCYLSYSEKGRSDSSPISTTNETSSRNKQFLQEGAAHTRPECLRSSSDENSDSTWTPCRKVKPLQALRKKKKKKKKKVGRRQKRQPMSCEKRNNASPLQLKKKCVNGFIMFCRLNRKHYIRACPGMASTAATRELAQLWRMMTKQERKPYCMKARRFSRLNNRIVRDDFSSEEEDLEPPKPFHLLLAEKSLSGTQNFGDLSLLELIP